MKGKNKEQINEWINRKIELKKKMTFLTLNKIKKKNQGVIKNEFMIKRM